jgi:Ca2+-binding EF-hand superfamily protein
MSGLGLDGKKDKSGHAHHKGDKKEKNGHSKDHSKGDKKPAAPLHNSPKSSVVGVIKTTAGEKPRVDRSVDEKSVGKDGKAKDGKAKTEKGILKRKKTGDGKDKKTVGQKPKSRHEKPHKKSLVEKIAASFGFYIGEVTLLDPWAVEAAQALDLQMWHLRRLKMRFDKIDLDSSGNIDYDEFFESIGEVRSPFTDKLFALIDLDGSGTIEFDEYVRVMATYCMFTKDEILRFCFDCFDVDKSGTIDEKEFVELCKCINNASPAFPGNFKKALEEFDVNEDGLIDYGEFGNIDTRYPLVLFPAFRLQDVMQRNSLGERAWQRVIENYQRSKTVEEYKANHGGRLPPEPPLKMLGKLFFPCFFKDRTHIKVGLDMENRHRS